MDSATDGVLPSGIDSITPDSGPCDNTNQPVIADENGLLSMGPLLPANPEDTTCYWYDKL